jgi:lipoate-protein ligase B
VLQKGGYIALNLTDAHTNRCVDALINIVVNTLKGEYLGFIASRKAVGASRWVKKAERKITIDYGIDPIWVFRKP